MGKKSFSCPKYNKYYSAGKYDGYVESMSISSKFDQIADCEKSSLLSVPDETNSLSVSGFTSENGFSCLRMCYFCNGSKTEEKKFPTEDGNISISFPEGSKSKYVAICVSNGKNIANAVKILGIENFISSISIDGNCYVSKYAENILGSEECSGITSPYELSSITKSDSEKISTIEAYPYISFIDNSAFKMSEGISISTDNALISKIDGIIYGENEIKNVQKDCQFDNGNFLVKSSVEKIQEGAFMFCDFLKSIDFGSSSFGNKNGIPYCCFKECNSLSAVSASNNALSYIGDYAFYKCESLSGSSDFSSNSSMTSLGRSAFEGDPITSFLFPSSLQQIGDGCFRNCKQLTSKNNGNLDLTAINSLKAIGDECFYGCSSVISVALPDSVASIGNDSFSNCFGITSMDLRNCTGITYMNRFNGMVSLKDVYLPLSITGITEGIFSGNVLLSGTNMSNLAKLEKIPANAFQSCRGITSMDLSESEISSIGDYSFSDCSSMTAFSFPSGITEIGKSSFETNPLKSIDLSSCKNLKKIGNRAFADCIELTSVTFNEGLETLEDAVFDNAHSIAGTIVFPSSLKYIGSSFHEAVQSLSAFSVPEDNSYFSSEEGILYDKAKNELISYPCQRAGDSFSIPDSVTNVYDAAFESANIKMLEIGSGLTSHGVTAFLNMNYQSAFTVDSKNVYYKVGSCGELYHRSSADDSEYNTLVQVPIAFDFSSGDKNGIFEIPEGTVSIEAYALHRNSSVTSVSIPSTLSSLNSNALTTENENLSSITISTGNTHYVSESGMVMNYGKTSVIMCPIKSDPTDNGTLYLNENITILEESSFLRNKYIKELSLSNCIKLSSIGSFSFKQCVYLAKAVLPSGVTDITRESFGKCSAMTEFDCYGEYFRSYSLEGCVSLTDIYLRGDSIPTIEGNPFVGVSTKENVTLHVKSDLLSSFKESPLFFGLFKEIVSL